MGKFSRQVPVYLKNSRDPMQVLSTVVEPAKPPDPFPGHLKLADVKLEPARIHDLNLIYNSWAANQAQVETRYGAMAMAADIFKVEVRGRINRLVTAGSAVVARPTAEFMKSHNQPFSEKDVFGWICYDFDRKTHMPVVHFLSVKRELWRKGLGLILLREAAGVPKRKPYWGTHISGLGATFMQRTGGLWNRCLLEYVNDYANPYRP